MQYYWLHVGFSAAYLLILALGTISFIFCSILWSYWHDIMGSPEHGCILFAANLTITPEALYFVGGKRGLCHFAIYGLIPVLVVALWAAFVHIFYICQRKSVTHSEISLHVSKCVAIPKIEAITCFFVAFYNLSFGIFLLAAFLFTCHRYTPLTGRDCKPNISPDKDAVNSAFCYEVLSHLDICSGENVRRDKINTPGLLISIITMQFLSALIWIVCMTANLVLYLGYKIKTFELEI